MPAQMKHAWLGFFMYVVCVLKGKSDYFVMGHLLVLQASSQIMVNGISVGEAVAPRLTEKSQSKG